MRTSTSFSNWDADTTDTKTTPPSTPSKDEAPGYAEKQPRDKGDAQQPAPEPEPEPEVVIEATPEPEPVVETVCYEDQECWNWETMGNRTSGVAITLYTGEVWTGNLTANGDGTYTFVRK